MHDRHATSDLDWIERYGWQAFLDGGDEVVLARWNEDGVLLTQSARNYIIMGEARFDLDPLRYQPATAALGVSHQSPPRRRPKRVEQVARNSSLKPTSANGEVTIGEASCHRLLPLGNPSGAVANRS